MSFGDEVISRLFPDSGASNELLLCETLERSKNDQNNYQRWIATGGHLELSRMFHLAYAMKKHGVNSSTNVRVLRARHARAFSISRSEQVNAKSFQYFFDYLKDLLVAMGYQLNRSEREIADRSYYVEIIDRHYLDFPDEPGMDGRCNQLYGNISIEHVSVDDKPSYIKLMTTYQTGNRFTKPRSFDELARILFNY